jgi:SAM-dependent MidA family methyltransferase
MALTPSLPAPGPDAVAASQQLQAVIAAEIRACGGWISFARYMELALYAPGLGYYSGGAHKFGDFASGGDFVTAPELTPLFGAALASQVAQIMAGSESTVMEVGAGSGRLAVDLLRGLAGLDALPERYEILELSGTLRARQQETLAREVPQWLARVHWLDELPEHISGCVVGNEVLDAMPTHQVRWSAAGVFEGGVALDAGVLVAAERPAPPALCAAATEITGLPDADAGELSAEISLAVRAWIGELARRLKRGGLLLIDYGMSRRELYQPGRGGGSIRCHYRHHVHDDPFWFPGLSDITSHVDFTAVAEAGFGAGLEVAGYANQASFLINCGLGELMQAEVGVGATAADEAYKTQAAIQRLISPNEMGELFKVIALTRGVALPLRGFAMGDRTHAL